MNLRKKISTLLSLLLALALSGTLGFHTLEGWNWLDSAYATVITLGTVGYGDFHPVTVMGKIFVMGLVIFGLGVISYALVELTAFVVEGHLNKILRLRKVDNMIKKVQGHFIVCGAGRTGQAHHRGRADQEQGALRGHRPGRRRSWTSPRSIPTPTSPVTPPTTPSWSRAGIRKAKALAATLETDELNLFLMLTAKNLNPILRCVSPLVNESARTKMGRAGADAVVAPNAIGGLRLASEMLRPNVVSFLDIA